MTMLIQKRRTISAQTVVQAGPRISAHLLRTSRAVGDSRRRIFSCAVLTAYDVRALPSLFAERAGPGLAAPKWG